MAVVRAKYSGARDIRFGPTLAAEHLRSEEQRWEVFQGRLLDPAHTREVKDFEAKAQKGQLHYLFTVPLPRNWKPGIDAFSAEWSLPADELRPEPGLGLGLLAGAVKG